MAELGTPFPEPLLDDGAELGAVTDRSVRLWIRAPERSSVEARLHADGRDPLAVTLAPSPAADWTACADLTLPAPAPCRPFTCHVLGRTLHGRFAPSPGDHAGFTFGFGSCHRPYALDGQKRVRLQRNAAIYDAIRDEMLAANAAFFLLVGDQIYADELDPISIRDHLPGDEDHPPPLDVAIAAYRRVTRGFLGQSNFRALREALPTLCMWDDHDIFNDWGSRRRESPLDQCLFQAAARVFAEYQLPRNPVDPSQPPPFQAAFQYGTAGFVLLDIRGARSYQDGLLLGRDQWAWFQRYLAGAEARDLQTLFVVVSVPVAHVSRWLVEAFQWLPGHKGNDVRDRWCSNAFIQSRDAFLDALLAWEAERPHRQVVLLSGDVHAASVFTITRRDGGGTVHQFTSSAMTTISTRQERILNRISTWWPNLFEPRFHLARHAVVMPNNAGRVDVEPLPAGGHRVTFTVRAWDAAAARLVSAHRIVAEPASPDLSATLGTKEH